jgi:hypothetical protein
MGNSSTTPIPWVQLSWTSRSYPESLMDMSSCQVWPQNQLVAKVVFMPPATRLAPSLLQQFPPQGASTVKRYCQSTPCRAEAPQPPCLIRHSVCVAASPFSGALISAKGIIYVVSCKFEPFCNNGLDQS